MFVLLTGATGYIGGHITSQLLAAGHSVRGIVRPGRGERLLQTFPDAGSKLEYFELESLESSDYTEAFKGIDAVIHSASPAFMKGETNKEVFEGGYKGTIHIVESAIAYGIKRIIYTGSVVSMWDADYHQAFTGEVQTSKTFGNFDKNYDYENAPNALAVYQATKVIADKHIWELQAEHPDVDLTVIIVPTVFGPYVENYPTPKSRTEIGTSGFIYALVKDTPETGEFAPDTAAFSHTADVRDVAKAHVLALTAPKVEENKRFLLCSKQFTWKEVVEIIREKRPEVADRLPKKDAAAPLQMNVPFDLSLTEKVLGLKEYLPFEETILGSLDQGLKLEKA